MIALKICFFFLGLVFLVFGYLIYFKGKYNLINGFEEDLKLGRKTASYAKRIGLIEFIIGLVSLITFLLILIFA